MINCRFCSNPLTHNFLNLPHQPPSNALLSRNSLSQPEVTYPLQVYTCDHCWLTQIPSYASSDELFTDDYVYFSSTSSSWLSHAKSFTNSVVSRFNLDNDSFVLEIASNDGYLLKNFVDINIPCLGIEPTVSTATAAINSGIPTLVEFLSVETALKLLDNQYSIPFQLADLIVANNVLAHVPDIRDFFEAITLLSSPEGVVCFEFPHLLNLLKLNQFDTIYHEHYSYLSLTFLENLATAFSMHIFDVETLPTHGGSLRVYLSKSLSHKCTDNVLRILEMEKSSGLLDVSTYYSFAQNVDNITTELLSFLLDCKHTGKNVAAYGAAAKGNTLFNSIPLKTNLVHCCADASHSKQNKFMPGSHIPIIPPEDLFNMNIDYLLVLPWNLLDELKTLPSRFNNCCPKLVTAIPKLMIHE